VRELIKRNVLVLQTGCAAQASAKAGALTPETALNEAGASLREVCETVGIPPVLHMGSCVDNGRILEAATEIVLEGGLGDDISQIPAVGLAPEWMSEKAVTIACYFRRFRLRCHSRSPVPHLRLGQGPGIPPRRGAEALRGRVLRHPEPAPAVEKIMELIEQKARQARINRKMERKLFDMKDRREINV